MPDLRVDELPEEGLMLPACCDTEAWRFTDPLTREAMVRVLHDEGCPTSVSGPEKCYRCDQPAETQGMCAWHLEEFQCRF